MRLLSQRILTGALATVGVLALGTTAAFADTYEVEPGDTLSSIADGLDDVDDWQDLAEVNDHQLDDPNLILPGQVLALPGTEAAATASDGSDDTSEESEPASEQATGGSVDLATWERLAECESSGNWSIDTGNGYYGGLQFAQRSWEWVGGSGSPHEASKQEQIDRAEILLDRQGWNAWPACSSQLGLR